MPPGISWPQWHGQKIEPAHDEKISEGFVDGEATAATYLNWVWFNTYRYIFSGMNIHLPAILMFTSKSFQAAALWEQNSDRCPAARLPGSHVPAAQRPTVQHDTVRCVGAKRGRISPEKTARLVVVEI